MLQNASSERRCAIYTRKSFEPPLNQELTSLQSQRSICSAYIASQAHKGWKELSKNYEDVGRSGANLKRPALQDLLTDIEKGLVDVVLVYKLDRITRTLLDFVRLVDLFERYGVVFVSITQNFDTSDSMGRLIRNVLLTFAQFEREIASDRMRDKKMVMKQSGRWTGGNAPIGYDLRRGKLIINPSEQAAVRCIFETYVREKRLSAVHKTLIAHGHRRKVWRSADGNKHGGNHISLTSLHHVLQNPIYIGEVTHRGDRFPGLHEPILARELWERAQAVLRERQLVKPRVSEHLLVGTLWDAYGRRMNARQARNGAGSHRYYESAPCAWAARRDLKILRVQSAQIETLVITALSNELHDVAAVRQLCLAAGLQGTELNRICSSAPSAAVRMSAMPSVQLSGLLKLLISRVEVGFEGVEIAARTDAIITFLRWDGVGFFRMSDLDLLRAKQFRVFRVPIHLYRQRRETWVPVHPRRESRAADPKLLELLQDAKIAQEFLLKERELSLEQIAWSLGKKPAHFSRLLKLNYLAPDIVTSIIDGTQPDSLTRGKLMQMDLPLDWALQRRLLEVTSRRHYNRVASGESRES